MTDLEYAAFKSLVSQKQDDLLRMMAGFLEGKYPKNKIKATKDYIIAEGDIPIGLVSHLDTVHRHPAEEVYYDREEQVIWSPQGLGADDRAGILAIIRILCDGFRPYIYLTTAEETGGWGAKALVKENPAPQLKYLIELDRCGSRDCVFYTTGNDAFIHYVEGFGFKEDIGTYSDISEISPVWKICSTNLSVGYYNEHTLGEYLWTRAWRDTVQKVERMLAETNIPDFEYVRVSDAEIWNRMFHLSGYDNRCFYCDREDKGLNDVYSGEDVIKLCDECVTFGTAKCQKCNSIFEIGSGSMDDKFCYKCAEELRVEKWI